MNVIEDADCADDEVGTFRPFCVCLFDFDFDFHWSEDDHILCGPHDFLFSDHSTDPMEVIESIAFPDRGPGPLNAVPDFSRFDFDFDFAWIEADRALHHLLLLLLDLY
jgi:hypothetical protein